jgi:hypothetical protein
MTLRFGTWLTEPRLLLFLGLLRRTEELKFEPQDDNTPVISDEVNYDQNTLLKADRNSPSSSLQLADILTKILDGPKLGSLVAGLLSQSENG